MSTLKWRRFAPLFILAICLRVIPANASGLAVRAAAPGGQAQLKIRVLEGDPAPPEIGGTYSRIQSSSISNAGDFVFSADLAGSAFRSVVVLDGFNAILKSGDSCPAGGSFAQFLDVDIAGPFVLFRAMLQGTAIAEGVFLWTATSGIQTLAVTGDQTNGRDPGLTYESFGQLTVNSVSDPTGKLAVTPVYAFSATLANNQGQAVAWSDYAPADFGFGPPPITALTTGDVIVTHTLKMEVMESFSLPRLTESGLNVLLTVQKPDGRQIHLPIYLDEAGAGGYELDPLLTEGLKTRAGKTMQIEAPISASFESAVFLLVQCVKDERQTKAILTDDVQGFLPISVLLQTGGAAPTVHKEKIKDIGAPVSNPGDTLEYPGVPQGLVAPVTLSNGQNALWVATITVPAGKYKVNASLQLIGGATGAVGAPSISSVTPVKLTDTGFLLLTGAEGSGVSAQNGVFIFSGLF